MSSADPFGAPELVAHDRLWAVLCFPTRNMAAHYSSLTLHADYASGRAARRTRLLGYLPGDLVLRLPVR